MATFESDEKFISEIQENSGFQRYLMQGIAKDRVLRNIHTSLNDLGTPRRQRSFWKNRILPGVAALVLIFVGTGGVALAEGVNVLNVVVRFVHNITTGAAYGSGYGLEHTTVSLTIKTSDAASATKQRGSSGTTQQGHTLTQTQMMSDGGLFATGYNTQLNDYLGADKYPKLMGNKVVVSNIQAYSIERTKDIFYMYVSGYISGKNNQIINLDAYHKTGGDVIIQGQTLANIKKQIKVSGINATYVEFTNDKTLLSYLTWKSGSWIFVLRSNNVPESSLVQYAQGIESQVRSN